MDNAGRPNETDMIDGEPYSVDDLKYYFIHDPEWWTFCYQNMSDMDKIMVCKILDKMLKGQDPQEAD